MAIFIRLTNEEEIKLNELKKNTGLSTTALVKKRLFDNDESHIVNKNILPELGRISTSVNLVRYAVENEDWTAVIEQTKVIEKGVNDIWRSL